MVTLLNRDNSKRSSAFQNDDFGKYLKKQTNKTTFNGRDIAAFSWYKKALGLV